MSSEFDDDVTPVETPAARRRDEANAELEAHQRTVYRLTELVAPEDVPIPYRLSAAELKLKQLQERIDRLAEELAELKRR
jgi:hypothetical protein